MRTEEIASRLATIKKSLQATDLHTLTLRVEEVEKLLEEYTSQLTDSNELPRDDRMVIEILNKIVIHSKKCRDTEVGHGVVVAFANECLILLNDKHNLLASKDARIRELEEWISVDDRLPEITLNTMSDWVITFDKSISRIDKAFYSEVTGWQAEHGEPMNVSHWKNLPTPPKN